jgi:hypothetical protein
VQLGSTYVGELIANCRVTDVWGNTNRIDGSDYFVFCLERTAESWPSFNTTARGGSIPVAVSPNIGAPSGWDLQSVRQLWRWDLKKLSGAPPPPPPSLTVTVTGPSFVDGCTSGTWTATTTGGISPITYQWTVEGGSYNTGTNNHMTYTNSGGSLSIFVRATATDANGVTGTSSPIKANIRLPGGC